MPEEIVDGYCHCGLSKYEPIEVVREAMDRLGIARNVLVQHLGEYDNNYIERIVAESPERYAGVMLIDAEASRAVETLKYWAGKGVFRGLRMMARTVRSHAELWDCAAELGLNIVVYDEPSIAPYAQQLAEVAERQPNVRLVISHLGMLDPAEFPGFQSHREILELSGLDNIYVQLSGFHMFGEVPYKPMVPIVEGLVESFGPKRLLYGTNYPVPEDELICRRELELICSGKLGVGGEALPQVLSRTALDLWFERS